MELSFRRSNDSGKFSVVKDRLLVAVFPVLFVVLGLLMPVGDPIEFPQFAVFLPLFMCAAGVMFVTARQRLYLRRTKYTLGVIYLLVVLELVVWRALSH